MTPFEDWTSRLRASCGHYDACRDSRQNTPGRFDLAARHGIGIAQIACRIARIERTLRGIRRDDQEHFFLLHQRAGQTALTHAGREALLEPGALVLLDSTRAAELRFGGAPVSLVSAHLPRGLVLAARGRLPAAGRPLAAAHPLHGALLALLAEDTQAAAAQPLLFELAVMAFGEDPEAAVPARVRDPLGRFRLIRDALARRIADSELTLDGFARETGLSRRQLQREFRSNGSSFTLCLQELRLKRVAEALRFAACGGARAPVAELAYAAGFRDLSHFNRLFRTRYATSPRTYAQEAAAMTANH
ncbi:helix-turn-helix domain-containing protein [Cribrihabitans pelagius]|uniref:helix-turn-helix domain-containing protein n=1 Tax=Cribrihabitans pelagius TaxID=1765746 RepID=UPI003B58C991